MVSEDSAVLCHGSERDDILLYFSVTLAEATLAGFIQNLSFELIKDNGTETH